MPVYQNFWDKLRAILEADVPLKDFLDLEIIFGSIDKAINNFPALIVEPLSVDEAHFVHPRKKKGQLSFRFSFKISNVDSNLEIKQSYEAIEILGNALDKNVADYGGLLLHQPIFGAPTMEKMGDNVRDVIIETTFEILPIFFFGGR